MKPLWRTIPIMTAASAAALLMGERPSEASPRALPFTYTSETLGKGEVEIEQFADLTWLKGLSTSTGAPVDYAATTLQTELEFGALNRLELGVYFVITPSPGDSITQTAALPDATGIKQRIRYAFADPGEWPLDLNAYFEVVENQREVELEAKLIVQRRIGRLRLVANLSGELELYYAPIRDYVLNPSAGATVEIVPAFHVGIDSFGRVEFPDPPVHPRPFSLGPAIYAGPAVLFNIGKLWWSTGFYARFTEITHSLVPSEPYGPFWLRTAIGVEL